MEPTRIVLHNFTSYADAELDLEGVELAALVGQNGAGKSSIIDAFLWALFGEATKGGARAVDNYVRRGEQECRVTVEFRLQGQVYRVVRHRSAGKGKSLLEVFQEVAAGEWQPFSGKTIAETQEAIEQLLRMDYRTFTASSMILQGQSASLTADMTDTERKEVLARILGLDIWDRLQEEARCRARGIRAEVKAQADVAVQLETRAGRRPEVEASISTQEESLTDAGAAVERAEGAVANLEHQVRQRPVLEQQAADLDGQMAARAREKEEVAGDLERTRSDIKAFEEQLARLPELEAAVPEAEIDHAFAAKQVERQQGVVIGLEAEAARAATIKEQIADVDRSIAAREKDKERLTQEGKTARRQLEEQQAILGRGAQIREAAAACQAMATDLQDLDHRAQEFAEVDKQCREMEALVTAWDREHDTEVARVEAELNAAHRQSRTLGEAPCGDDLRPVCPLLGGARDAAQREIELADRMAALQAQTNPHVAGWMGLMGQRDDLAYDAGAHSALRKALTERQQDAQLLPVLEAAEQRVTELQAQLNDLRTRFQENDGELEQLRIRRQELQESLDTNLAGRLQEVRDGLTARKNAEQQARTKWDRLQHSLEELKTAAPGIEQRLVELRQRIANLEARIEGLGQEVENLRARRESVQLQLDGLATLEQELETARTALGNARRREAEIREAIGRLRQELAEVERAATEAAEIRTRIAAREREAQVYEILDQAAGKKSGVPALIVENAVPQIEQLTNDLLGRMAGGRLAVRLDTQVEGKTTGTQQEVLRITVLDGGEDRPYQTYSGAERFMVDLALRIALSKFLAHRSGAEIKLLVLDEGLGALDAANRPHVMTALQEAAREFSKVLVVTHIAELQDALPQRIEVSRGVNGSTIKVVA